MKLIFSLLLLTAVNLQNTVANEGAISDHLRQKALQGDIFSQIKLGEEFLYGVNRSRNLNLAFYYFNMAAEQNSDEGNFYVGFCYEYGYGVVKNEIIAYSYYEKALALDEARFKVALILEKGLKGGKIDGKYYRSIDQDKERAKEIFNSLVQKKYAPAMVKIAEKLLQAREISAESGKYIFELLSDAAKQDDIQARKYLIDCYLRGIGTSVNEDLAYSEALKLYSENVKGIAVMLGGFYENGIGVAPDMLKAIEYYQVAAKENDSFASVKIAEQYLSGFYLKSDVNKALEILHNEMKNNNPTAIKILGDCFAKGVGLDKDERQAFLFYLRAAAMGEVNAQYELAECFRDGRGTPIDESAVFFWVKQGTALGDVKCMRTLAECYALGIGTKQDLKLAESLFRECIRRGDRLAVVKMQEVMQ